MLQLPRLIYVNFNSLPTKVLTGPISHDLKHLYVHSFRGKQVPAPPPSTVAASIHLKSIYTGDPQPLVAFLLKEPNSQIKTSRIRKLVVDLKISLLDQDGRLSMTWTFKLLKFCADTLEDFTLLLPHAGVFLDYRGSHSFSHSFQFMTQIPSSST